MDCPVCGHANRGGARFCLNCGAELVLRCPSCDRSLPGEARFCDACGQTVGPGDARAEPAINAPPHLAEKILTSRSALEGERKQVTAMFADLTRSMDMSETVDPEDWHRIIDRLFEVLAEGVYRFEGTVNQFTGDGILALFGAPIAHEDHALRACYSALHIRDRLAVYARELKRDTGMRLSMRIGLNSGEVVVGTIGDDLRMDYTAAGHTVGLAQRMEQLAESGTIYLARNTAELVSGYVETTDLGPFTVKGVRQPVHVYELTGSGAQRTRLDVARQRGLSRFVGRRDELATLESALDDVEGGRGQVVALVGEAGVGKSRLCFEFVERARSSGLRVFETHGLAHGKAFPFLPVLQLLRRYFGIGELDTPVAARQKIAGSLLLLGEEFRDALPLVFDFLGVPDPDLAFPQLDPEVRKNQLFGAITHLLRARSDRGPALILIEDLHWLDTSSVAFVEHLVDAVPATRTLLLLNTRPEFTAPWIGSPPCVTVTVSPLTADEVADLLYDRIGGDPSLSRLARRIAERTAGNPLFIEEVVNTLVESGALRGEPGAYTLTRDEPDVVIPTTVQAVLAARLDRLAEREKTVLQTAAVIGPQVSEPTLRRVADLTEPELAESLAELVRADFLSEVTMYPEAEYMFRHPLMQDVAYSSQLSDRRRRTHLAAAAAIADLYRDRLEERTAVIAKHWREAGEHLEAARWSRRAAEWAGHNDPSSAFEHWNRVLSHVAELPEDADTEGLELAACIGYLNFGTRLGVDADRAHELFDRGRDLAERTDDRRSRARLLLTFGRLRGLGGHIEEAAELSLEASRLAEESGWAGLRLAAAVNMSAWRWQSGELIGSLEVADAAASEIPKHPRLGAEHLGYSPYIWLVMHRGRLLTWLGRGREAPDALDPAISLASENDEREVLCWGHQAYADLGWLTGDAPLATGHATRALEISERLGTTLLRWSSYLSVGRAKLCEGTWVEAADALEHALEEIRRTGIGLHAEGFVLSGLAEAALGLGQSTRAVTLAEDAVRATSVDTGAGAWARRVLARVVSATSNDTVRALSLLDDVSGRRGGRGQDAIIDAFVLADRALLATEDREAAVATAAGAFRDAGAPLRAQALEAAAAGSAT